MCIRDSHRADVAMDHTNSLFQLEVKKNGYMMGNCRFVGKGNGIHFPEHIWRLIMVFAILDCAVPPELPNKFKIGRDYQYITYSGKREGPIFTYQGSTASGLVKFRKKGTTIVKRVKTELDRAYPKMPKEEYLLGRCQLNKCENHNWSEETTAGTALNILQLLVHNRTHSNWFGIMESANGVKFTTRYDNTHNPMGEHLDDLKKLCFKNYNRSVAGDWRVDYNIQDARPTDIFDKENMKIFYKKLINISLEGVKRRYLWLYKKGDASAIDACKYENAKKYWDALFYHKWWDMGGYYGKDEGLSGLDDEEMKIAKTSHHKIRNMGNEIGKIVKPFLNKIRERRQKYKAYQDGIMNIKLAERGVVTDFFEDNSIGANHLLEN